MDIDIVAAGIDDKEVLRNLLEKYDYEFSQYDKRDVNKLGLYGYEYLDHYWTEKNRFAFFVLVDSNLAGFVMVNDFCEGKVKTDFSLSEFFVMYKYRRFGVGSYTAKKIFGMLKGKWQLKRHPNNKGSALFWDKVIGEYTKGNYRLICSCPDAKYDDGTLGDLYYFET